MYAVTPEELHKIKLLQLGMRRVLYLLNTG